MTRTGKRATKTANAKEQTEEASMMEAAEQHEEASGSGSSSNIDFNTLQAMDRITDNITKVIDAKVDTVLAAIRDQTTQIQALGVRVGEAEDQITSVETTTDSLHAKMTHLEKQVGQCRNILMTWTIVGADAMYVWLDYLKVQREQTLLILWRNGYLAISR